MEYKKCIVCDRNYMDYTIDSYRETCSTRCEREYILSKKIKILIEENNLERIKISGLPDKYYEKIKNINRIHKIISEDYGGNKNENVVLKMFHKNDLFPTIQYRIGQYRADFVFQKKRIVIELDGPNHSLNENTFSGKKDYKRNEYYKEKGWIIIIIKYRYNCINKSDMERTIKNIKKIVNNNNPNMNNYYLFEILNCDKLLIDKNCNEFSINKKFGNNIYQIIVKKI